MTPVNNDGNMIDPVDLLQRLIRFDTTNPPGNEAACIHFLRDLLQASGFEVTLLGKAEDRPNLITRLAGSGNAPPLLLQGHVDVVTTAGQEWTHPPFEGVIADDFVWGRGALDMKGGVAMMVAALINMKLAGNVPNGDIILCLLADEEVAGGYGADYLVNDHADQFAGVKHSIGEFGGFPFWLGGVKLYPIQVAERVGCQMEMTIRGAGGHGALLHRNGAMAKLGRILTRLDKKRLPIHITPVTHAMVSAMAEATSGATSFLLEQLLKPRLTGRILDLLGERMRVLEPSFCNTVNATVVQGGEKINVVPSEITLRLDGRMLPGFSPAQMISEVRQLIGEDVEIRQIGQGVPNMNPLDLSQFELLAGILRELDPAGNPIPYMLPAVSDARHFATLGIQNYGFLPLDLPEGFDFSATVHAADERVPVKAIEFGTRGVGMFLKRYGR